MNLQQQHAAVTSALSLVRAQGVIEPDPVDFVEWLIRQGSQTRDLDSLADDIVCHVLRWDDLCEHVKGRLDTLQAFEGAQYRTPASNPRLVAENIVNAIHAIVRPRLSRGSGL
jgi:hypothetical protein